MLDKLRKFNLNGTLIQKFLAVFKKSKILDNIPKISPRAYIFQRPLLRGLSTEGNLRLKIDWANLVVGSKFTAFALFYFVSEGNFPITSPPFRGGGEGLCLGGDQ